MKGKIGTHGILLTKEEEQERQTKGGIYIPQTKKETQKIGTVVLVGTGTPEKPMEAKLGDKVYYKPLTAREVEIDDVKYDLIDSDNALYIV